MLKDSLDDSVACSRPLDPAVSMRLGGLLSLCALLSLGVDGCLGSGVKVGTETCLTCHNGQLAPDQSVFTESPHFLNGVDCEDCHGPGFDHVRIGGRAGLFIENFRNVPFARTAQVCSTCHASAADGFLQSGHALAEAVTCTGCHLVHEALTLTQPAETNALCLQCHQTIDLPDDEAVDFHTGPMHPVDPAGTGASRCAPCHLPPLEQQQPRGGFRSHSLRIFSPSDALAEAAAGVFPLSPSSCAGTVGCHDPDFPYSGPARDPNDLDLLRSLESDFLTVGGIP